MIYDTPINVKNKLGLDNFNVFYPTTYIPTPTKADYNYGFLTRYFVGKRNQNSIIETNARDYKMTDGSFFIKAQCDWQLTGPKNNIYTGTMLQTSGVEEYNRIQVNELRMKLPGIENILTNHLQFWAGQSSA